MLQADISSLLSLPDGLDITALDQEADTLLISVTSIRSTAVCPLCATPSPYIHSLYQRKPTDLPMVGRPIRLLLTVRKFFCRSADCRRQVFAERLPDLVAPFSRLTTRLRTALREIGFTSNGKAGARLADSLGMSISDTSLLGSLLSEPIPAPMPETVRVIGIDDWSWRRGQRYGTIIVDLQRHRVIDLLADRSAETVRAWLADHPQIEIVSRDRGAAYVDGVTQGAPQATQVADRWHLYQNLGDAVEAFLVRQRVRIPASAPLATAAADLSSAPSTTPEPAAISTTPAREKAAQERQQHKWSAQQHIHELRAQGLSLHKIAQELGLARNTVRKYARQAVPVAPPEPAPRPARRSKLDAHEEYLLKRWREGCDNAALLFRELGERGFAGGKSIVRDYIRYLRQHPAAGSQEHPRQDRAKAAAPREIRWLLARERQELNDEEHTKLQWLLDNSSEAQAEVRSVYELLQDFHAMLKQKRPEQLANWLEQAKRSGIGEMQSFAAGIERDYAAVKAGITLPWSQGQTEGQVNKLKTVKRMMYGRAGFALLRQRMLHNGAGSELHQKPG